MIGSVPTAIIQPSRASCVVASLPRRKIGQHRGEDPHDVAPKVRQHGHQRADLQHGRERRARVLPPKQCRHDPQMGRAADRNEFRQALHDCQHDDFKPVMA